MDALEQVITRGNRGHDRDYADATITCADGFTISVIAGGGTYCTPRPALCSYPRTAGLCSGPHPYLSEVACDFSGPYTHVEVGFPSGKPEPWADWEDHFDGGGDDPREGVYGYVPADVVRALVAAHGGVA